MVLPFFHCVQIKLFVSFAIFKNKKTIIIRVSVVYSIQLRGHTRLSMKIAKPKAYLGFICRKRRQKSRDTLPIRIVEGCYGKMISVKGQCVVTK